MTGLIMIGGGLLTAISINMFSAIGMNIENFWMEYVVIFGGAALPVVSVFLINIYPDITGKITPVLARIFSPLAMITLAVYLVFLLLSGNSNVMKDRNLLIILNIILFAVLVLVLFSISEIDKSKKKIAGVFVLFLLTLLAILRGL
jgi:hypothetical protein